jgi:hypothetical protein
MLHSHSYAVFLREYKWNGHLQVCQELLQVIFQVILVRQDCASIYALCCILTLTLSVRKREYKRNGHLQVRQAILEVIILVRQRLTARDSCDVCEKKRI